MTHALFSAVACAVSSWRRALHVQMLLLGAFSLQAGGGGPSHHATHQAGHDAQWPFA
eukprot:CAMPEP_0176173202 /NCGR_PEP_ID=MMETSP0120_2-20121206/88742_1 /TAXON_ID=160619 /ORGANISM="Kryptoperidinium foliaceum, Strain CCMP 1326" /LENGTH=56 /DNA_ID=CAMNT_0017511217 /DNA_START=81 /DNA_END=247 /DNA_ORIENTATION=+